VMASPFEEAVCGLSDDFLDDRGRALGLVNEAGPGLQSAIWRQRRHLSQLDVASRSAVSARHLSAPRVRPGRTFAAGPSCHLFANTTS
jgi:hypothetical protein